VFVRVTKKIARRTAAANSRTGLLLITAVNTRASRTTMTAACLKNPTGKVF
jgi:hypothetical protein